IDATGDTVSQRSKEGAHDYRYFPEPDLPPLLMTAAEVDRIRARLPELPNARRQRFESEYGLAPADARVLTDTREDADAFEEAVRLANLDIQGNSDRSASAPPPSSGEDQGRGPDPGPG